MPTTYLGKLRHQALQPRRTRAVEEGTQNPSSSSVSPAELHSFWSLNQYCLKIDAGHPDPSHRSWLAKLEEATSTSLSVHKKWMKGTSWIRTLTTGPASDASASPARQRSSRRWEAILPRTSGPLCRAPQTQGFYTPFSQARVLIPANLTPNLLILIIDWVNKRRISNPLKYEPCLERLERRSISTTTYS